MNISKSVAYLAIFSASVMVCIGQSAEKVTITTDMGSGIFNLVYKTKATVPGTVQVSILDGKGQTVFNESITKTLSFSRPYNFNDQGQGDYKIVVEDKDGKIEKKILYTIKKVESHIQVEKIANAKDKYLLRISNTDSDQIHVKILDSDKNVLHEESITVSGKYAVVFNLNKINTSPTFEVSGSSGDVKTFVF
jgi:hypothetical protein